MLILHDIIRKGSAYPLEPTASVRSVDTSPYMEPRLRHLVVILALVASFLRFSSELMNGIGNALIIDLGGLLASQAIESMISFTIRSEWSMSFAW